MHDVLICACNGFIIDFTTLVTCVRAADACDIHSLFHPMPIEHGIPRRCGRLDDVAAFDRVPCRTCRYNFPVQFAAHCSGNIRAILLIWTKNFEVLEVVDAGEILKMRAGLPAAPEKPENLRL